MELEWGFVRRMVTFSRFYQNSIAFDIIRHIPAMHDVLSVSQYATKAPDTCNVSLHNRKSNQSHRPGRPAGCRWVKLKNFTLTYTSAVRSKKLPILTLASLCQRHHCICTHMYTSVPTRTKKLAADVVATITNTNRSSSTRTVPLCYLHCALLLLGQQPSATRTAPNSY